MTTPAWLQACAKEADKGYDPHLLSYHMGWSAAMESAEVKALKTKVEFQETLLASFGALITKLKAETVEQAKTIVLLTEDLQYVAGIVEKGTGSTVKDDSKVRAAILGYVQALEKQRDDLRAELDALKSRHLETPTTTSSIACYPVKYTKDFIGWSSDIPSKPGWYLHKCSEIDGKAEKIKVSARTSTDGTRHMWCETDMGNMPVAIYHDGLTDSQWTLWSEL